MGKKPITVPCSWPILGWWATMIFSSSKTAWNRYCVGARASRGGLTTTSFHLCWFSPPHNEASNSGSGVRAKLPNTCASLHLKGPYLPTRRKLPTPQHGTGPGKLSQVVVLAVCKTSGAQEEKPLCYPDSLPPNQLAHAIAQTKEKRPQEPS